MTRRLSWRHDQAATWWAWDAIGSFWAEDFGVGKPTTTLTLSDVYMAGDLAHLEGEYEVADKGTVTKGRYVQLWMQEGNAWRIHREM